MYDPGAVVTAAVSQLGVKEQPLGSNRGPQVRVYQSVTGAFGAPWCVSFAQWCLVRAGAGPIANRSASVFFVVTYARRRGWLVTHPVPGCLVAFLHGLGHMGVVRTVAGDSFTTVEGNAADSVLAGNYTAASAGPHVFVLVPGSHVKKRVHVWVPRFELVTGKGEAARVVIPWGKWSVVGPKVPKALARWRSGRIERKLVEKTVLQ